MELVRQRLDQARYCLPAIEEEKPQVLILDEYKSHNFLELIDVAAENCIHNYN